MSDGKVLYANHVGVHVLRFVGEVRCHMAPGLERFLDTLFEQRHQAPFVIDLTRTKMIDSTNLGVLAHIAIRMAKCEGPRPTIISSREEIDEVLGSMGFDEVFDIQAPAGPPPGRAGAVTVGTPDADRLAGTMLRAHRSLMELSGPGNSAFTEVITVLENRFSG